MYVDFAAPIDRVFAFLADPLLRPQWQVSLKSVEILGDDPTPRVGLQWIDHTVVGLRPQMEITRMQPYRLWAERGYWRGLTLDLALHFKQHTGAAGAFTRVRVESSFEAAERWGMVALLADRFSPATAKVDLGRAARILSDRADRDASR